MNHRADFKGGLLAHRLRVDVTGKHKYLPGELTFKAHLTPITNDGVGGFKMGQSRKWCGTFEAVCKEYIEYIRLEPLHMMRFYAHILSVLGSRMKALEMDTTKKGSESLILHVDVPPLGLVLAFEKAVNADHLPSESSQNKASTESSPSGEYNK